MTDTPDLGFFSHYPVLAAAVARTSLPFLELGCGYGSTPMLRLMGRGYVESWDSDPEWAKRFDAHLVQDWATWEPHQKYYGVVFIDCAPGEVRKDLAVKMKDRCTYVILHDAECDTVHGGGGNYQYDSILHHFKYAVYYRELRPHTLILSNGVKFDI